MTETRLTPEISAPAVFLPVKLTLPVERCRGQGHPRSLHRQGSLNPQPLNSSSDSRWETAGRNWCSGFPESMKTSGAYLQAAKDAGNCPD